MGEAESTEVNKQNKMEVKKKITLKYGRLHARVLVCNRTIVVPSHP